MVVFGGRSSTSKSLNDTWGLRQHRDGRWDWIAAPSKKQQLPEPRFQHCTSCSTHVLTLGKRVHLSVSVGAGAVSAPEVCTDASLPVRTDVVQLVARKGASCGLGVVETSLSFLEPQGQACGRVGQSGLFSFYRV